MQERAREAAVERQRKRSVQEVQARCGGPMAQEAPPHGSEQGRGQTSRSARRAGLTGRLAVRRPGVETTKSLAPSPDGYDVRPRLRYPTAARLLPER